MFGLLDASNFYVSCERVFQPRYEDQPVVVLSNNDSSVISRCQFVRGLGVPMGAPYFEVKDLLQQHNTKIFSSNYALYGSFHTRIVHFLRHSVPDIEVYSIDEAFLDLHGLDKYLRPQLGRLDEFAHTLRAGVKSRTGIPSCVGIGPTRTLAKLANRIAKKQPEHNGVVYLDSAERRQWALTQVAVEDVWGVGRQYAAKLLAVGVATAADLVALPDGWIRQHLGGVVGLRLVRELRGQPCSGLQPSEDGTLHRQSLCCSRTFGHPLSAFDDLFAAVTTFLLRAAEKLRRQGGVANLLTVFISKNRYGTEPPPYLFSQTRALIVPTADTTELARLARSLLTQLWQPGQTYCKAGVVLAGLEPAGQSQLSLFDAAPALQTTKRKQLMAELDAINQRFGRGTVRLAAAVLPPSRTGSRLPWEGKAQWLSSAYTTRLDGLLTVD